MNNVVLSYEDCLEVYQEWASRFMFDTFSYTLHDFSGKLHVLGYCSSELDNVLQGKVSRTNLETDDVSRLKLLSEKCSSIFTQIEDYLNDRKALNKDISRNFLEYRGLWGHFLKERLMSFFLKENSEKTLDIELLLDRSDVDNDFCFYFEQIVVIEACLINLIEPKKLNTYSNLSVEFLASKGELKVYEKNENDIWKKRPSPFSFDKDEVCIKIFSSTFNNSLIWSLTNINSSNELGVSASLSRFKE